MAGIAANLRPMSEFDPSHRSIVVYDVQNNRLYDWDWLMASAYREEAVLQADGVVRWRDLLLAGWRMALR